MEYNYIELGKKILKEGITENTRIGPTLSLHNQMLSFDLQFGFPLMTTKHVGQKSIITETLWYLKGTTSIDYLKENDVHVWDKFADANNDIGKTYSWQFRNFNGVDQVKDVINRLNVADKTTDRRAIINLYNVNELEEMSIPPCITTIQFNAYWIDNKKYVDSSIYQRSGDFCLGVPYDIAEMALLTTIIAAYAKATPKNMTVFYSNVHVYKAHIKTLEKQLLEEPTAFPELSYDHLEILKREPEDLTPDLFYLSGVRKRKKFDYELF